MTKAGLSEVNEVVSKLKKQTRNKIRKSLQTIQASADEQELTEENMIFSDEKSLTSKEKQTKSVIKAVAAEKENAPVRRSKRRTAAAEALSDLPEESQSSKTATKNPKVTSKKPSKAKKGRSTAGKKNEQKNILNQTKLNFPPISVPEEKEVPKEVIKSGDSENATFSLSTITEDSGFDMNAGTSQQNSPANSIAVFNSPDVRSNPVTPYGSEASILTIDSPPLSYWKDIAEQRRMALEKVLHENELLHDQLEVLEAENSQLKQLVKEAEELAQVVRGIIN